MTWVDFILFPFILFDLYVYFSSVISIIIGASIMMLSLIFGLSAGLIKYYNWNVVG